MCLPLGLVLLHAEFDGVLTVLGPSPVGSFNASVMVFNGIAVDLTPAAPNTVEITSTPSISLLKSKLQDATMTLMTYPGKLSRTRVEPSRFIYFWGEPEGTQRPKTNKQSFPHTTMMLNIWCKQTHQHLPMCAFFSGAAAHTSIKLK